MLCNLHIIPACRLFSLFYNLLKMETVTLTRDPKTSKEISKKIGQINVSNTPRLSNKSSASENIFYYTHNEDINNSNTDTAPNDHEEEQVTSDPLLSKQPDDSLPRASHNKGHDGLEYNTEVKNNKNSTSGKRKKNKPNLPKDQDSYTDNELIGNISTSSNADSDDSDTSKSSSSSSEESEEELTPPPKKKRKLSKPTDKE